MKGLLFTYALTYGGAVVSLVNPFYGLLIYICFALIKPESLWHWSVPPGNYSRIVAIALLLGWVINGLGNWNLGRAKVPIAMLLAFWLWAAVSTATCEHMPVGVNFLESKGKIVLPILVGITLVDSIEKLKQIAWTITLSLGYVAYDLNMSYFDGFNRLQWTYFGGMDNNTMAIGLVTGVGLAFFLGLGSTKWWQKLIAFAAAAFMSHAIFFSFSRGGMLALIIVGLVSFLVLPKRPAYLGLFGLGVIVALMMAGPEVRDEFSSVFLDAQERDRSAQSRLDMWIVCWDLMVDNPAVGVGPDHFPLMAHRFGFTHGKEAHTLWLQVGAELGFPGMLFLLGYYGMTIGLLLPLLREPERPGQDPFVLHIPRMVIASIFGFGIAAQFVSVEGLEPPYYVALLGIGALKVASMYPAAVRQHEPVSPLREGYAYTA